MSRAKSKNAPSLSSTTSCTDKFSAGTASIALLLSTETVRASFSVGASGTLLMLVDAVSGVPDGIDGISGAGLRHAATSVISDYQPINYNPLMDRQDTYLLLVNGFLDNLDSEDLDARSILNLLQVDNLPFG
jgi:hypothetical protein